MASSSPPQDREEQESRSPNPKRAPISPRNKRTRSRSRSPSRDGGKRPRRQDQTVAVCRDFLRRECFRIPVDCKFAHPPPSVTVDQDKVTICEDSLRNKCFRGDSCRYYHPAPHIQESSSKESRDKKTDDEKPNTICRDFLRGKCSRSQRECRYLHPSNNNNNNNNNQEICQDFLRGRCDRKSCRFSHASSRDRHIYNYEAPILSPPPPPRYSYNEETVQVCKDFLNGICNRGSCRYFHPNLTPKSYEPPYYERLKIRAYSPPRSAYDEETVLVCKDYINGLCRSDSCRYFHPIIEQPTGLTKTVYGTVYNKNASLSRLPSPHRTTYAINRLPSPPRSTYGLGVDNASSELSHHNIEHTIFDYGLVMDLSRSPPGHSFERKGGEICRDFMKGLCNRASCKFVHPKPEPNVYEQNYRESLIPYQSPPRTSQGEETGQVCRDFLKGLCNRESCKFVHVISEPKVFRQSYNSPPIEPPSPPRISHDEEKLMVCRDFMNNVCNRTTCKFAHPGSDTNVVNDKVELCRDFRRGACRRPVCHFYHPKTSR